MEEPSTLSVHPPSPTSCVRAPHDPDISLLHALFPGRTRTSRVKQDRRRRHLHVSGVDPSLLSSYPSHRLALVCRHDLGSENSSFTRAPRSSKRDPRPHFPGPPPNSFHRKPVISRPSFTLRAISSTPFFLSSNIASRSSRHRLVVIVVVVVVH